ncbi:TRAP transporter large permease [Photobacterium satsumensis]|uniref:TRAP transporter large permease n=1 Tax=Photobacterium satsumensis TaxID=2910239 RepID=UPI003D117B39
MFSPLFIYVAFFSLFASIPVFLCLLFAAQVGFIAADQAFFLNMLPQRLFAGIDTFTLLALPFFLLAGEIMGKGGITERLAKLANLLVGRMRGGLAQVNTVVSVLFASLTGSAIASTSAVGSMLIPTMTKEGYPKEFSTALTAAGSVIGPIIPPSIIMVIYAFIMNVSVGALFMAGIIPGILFCIVIMAINAYFAKKYAFPKRETTVSRSEIVSTVSQAILPLITPVIIVGGILSGTFSPTEAGAIAVLYSLILCLFVTKTLKLKDLPDLFIKSGITTATVLLVIGSALVFSWILTLSGLPLQLNQFILGISDNPYVLLILFNIVLLIAGMFLDAGAALLILGPTLIPPLVQAGADPIHIAIIACINLSIGVITPPFGVVLFVASSMSDIPVGRIIKAVMPYLIGQLILLGFITYIPEISLFLPRLMGFMN